MKILLSGSHGTGKSTINNDLIKLEQFKDYVQLDSVSEKFAVSLDTFKNPKSLIDFQLSVSLHCFVEYINQPNIISSRSFADTYAYSMYEYKKTGNIIFKQLADLAVSIYNNYNTKEYKHIYVPVMFDLESKGLRSTNKEFQLEIDNLFKEFYNIVEVDYLEIKNLDHNERIKEILEYAHQ